MNTQLQLVDIETRICARLSELNRQMHTLLEERDHVRSIVGKALREARSTGALELRVFNQMVVSIDSCIHQEYAEPLKTLRLKEAALRSVLDDKLE